MSLSPSLSSLHPHQVHPANASHDSTLEMTAPFPLTITVPCICKHAYSQENLFFPVVINWL